MAEKENIKQKINNAKRNVSDTNIGYATLNIEYLIKLIKIKKQEKQELTIPTIMYEIEQSYRKIVFSRDHSLSIVTRSDFCLLRTLIYVRKHPEVILETIDNADKSCFIKKKPYFRYTPNIRESINELMQDACSSIFNRYDFPTKVRFVKGDLSVRERIAIQKEILEMVTNYQKKLEKQMKASYTSNITEIAKILDENGCFEKSIERHNRRMRMLGLDDMQEKKTDKKSEPTTITSMSDWKKTDIVGKLPLETLIVASAFFTNRFCKEYISFKKSAFLMEELNFSEEAILKNDIVVPEDLSSVLIKYEFLQAEARRKFAELKQQNTTPSLSKKIDYVSCSLDYEPQEYEEYRTMFSELLPNCINDLFLDIQRFMRFDNAMEILYQEKDMALDSLIMFLLDKKTNINWGYIEEKTNRGNSIERKKTMVALGFDLEKFNTSIRLHKSLSELRTLIIECIGKDEIPVYEGEEEWFVKDKFGILTDMNTQVFRMLNRQERKQIKEKFETMTVQDRLYGFISHLNWIANGIIPRKHNKRRLIHLNTGIIEELDAKER